MRAMPELGQQPKSRPYFTESVSWLFARRVFALKAQLINGNLDLKE
jgi:hypothetical protein